MCITLYCVFLFISHNCSLHPKIIFCLQLEMVFKVVAWAISGNDSVFLDLFYVLYRRHTRCETCLFFLLLICLLLQWCLSQEPRKIQGNNFFSPYTLQGKNPVLPLYVFLPCESPLLLMPDTSLSVTKYVAFSPYIKKFCDTSLVSYNLIPL